MSLSTKDTLNRTKKTSRSRQSGMRKRSYSD
jgi:hypothetical protein